MKARIMTTAAILSVAAISTTLASGTASAATAAACKSSLSFSKSVSSRGTVSERWTVKDSCGRDYQEWQHGWTHYATGAYSTFHSYRNELRYPCWRQHKVTYSVSARGAARETVTDTSGGC